MKTTACVTFQLADGTLERCQAVYLGRGQNRDVYEVLGVVRALGQRVVVKLAPPRHDSSQRLERDILERAANRWLPVLFFFGATNILGRAFDVLVMTRCATSVDKLMDRMKNAECSPAAAMYIEQVFREVMYMLLYGFEVHGVSFGDLHVANVGVRLSLEEFEQVSWPLPAWDEQGFGRAIVGVLCVDAEGVKQTEMRGSVLNKHLKTFLTSFHQLVVALRHPSWQRCVRALSEPLTHYIANEASYSQYGMFELRKQAAIMGGKVQGELSNAFGTRASTVGVTPLFGGAISPLSQKEASWQATGVRCFASDVVVLLSHRQTDACLILSPRAVALHR
jgi:hypothetical protein